MPRAALRRVCALCVRARACVWRSARGCVHVTAHASYPSRPAFRLQALVDLGANANARLMDSCEELASFLRHTDFTPAVCMPAARFENCTPLHCAALRSFPQDIEWLLQNGSDPNAVTTLGERPQVQYNSAPVRAQCVVRDALQLCVRRSAPCDAGD